jgi:hypothetical protein
MSETQNTPQGATSQPEGSQPNSGTNQQFDPTKFVSQEAFNGTAALITRMHKTLEGLTGQKPLADQLAELGLIEKADDGTFRPRSTQPDTKSRKGEEDDPLARELKALKKQLAEKDAAIEKEQAKAAEVDRNRAVIAALAKAQAINPDRDFIHVAAQVAKNDAGAYVVKTKGQYGEDVELPLEAYATEFLKKNPELQRSTTPTGSGTPPGGAKPQQGTAPNGAKLIPASQWKDMGWYAANRAKFLTGEFVRGE